MENSTQLIKQLSATIRLTKDFPNTVGDIQNLVDTFISTFGYKAVNTTYHTFQPVGITHLTILTESHLAIHTWPEFKLVHFDLVSCKNISADVLKKFLTKFFEDNNINIEITEGEISLK